jgi:AraC-like DNA-binding protein
VSELAGVEVWETDNHFQAQNTLDTVTEASGVLRTIAISMNKIANDIRWMGSGPRAGLGEIDLPAVQPGSSIMPGKVNPVIAEALCQVAGQVVGNDTTVAISNLQGSNFELNVMMPVAQFNLEQSISILASGIDNFTKQCIVDVKATGRGPEMVEKGLMITTALAPEIGYDAAAAIAKEAYASGRTIREVAREKTSLSEADLDRILDPSQMTEPGLTGAPMGFVGDGSLDVADAARRLVASESALEAGEAIAGLLDALVEGGGLRSDAVRADGGGARAVADACEFLRAVADARPTLEDVATAVGMSKFALLRRFRATLGTTPHAYLVMVRVGRAQTLLAGGATPAEAAAGAGFSDQAHMGRWFRRLVGVTPAAYRRATRSAIPFQTGAARA